eukprot:NODE_2281_length_2249_cov_3.909519.p1 GENE.NODE_2281_length_2249_cov_3.909519~~NODE_2281_length_2249_cov_3.909519.p1  ORF type:complete len:598 (+),score=123.48 NODE_2281_length_2249_cov_3.909519:98-1795(+)
MRKLLLVSVGCLSLLTRNRVEKRIKREVSFSPEADTIVSPRPMSLCEEGEETPLSASADGEKESMVFPAILPPPDEPCDAARGRDGAGDGGGGGDGGIPGATEDGNGGEDEGGTDGDITPVKAASHWTETEKGAAGSSWAPPVDGRPWLPELLNEAASGSTSTLKTPESNTCTADTLGGSLRVTELSSFIAISPVQPSPREVRGGSVSPVRPMLPLPVGRNDSVLTSDAERAAKPTLAPKPTEGDQDLIDGIQPRRFPCDEPSSCERIGTVCRSRRMSPRTRSWEALETTSDTGSVQSFSSAGQLRTLVKEGERSRIGEIRELEAQLAVARRAILEGTQGSSTSSTTVPENSENSSDTIQLDINGSQQLGVDFSFIVYDEASKSGEMIRWIKIQCPGVNHDDIAVDIIFNGCVVTVKRQASRGVQAATWTQRFQFRPTDGVFDFSEDYAQLSRGYLSLGFRRQSFQSHVFRFTPNATSADASRHKLFQQQEQEQEQEQEQDQNHEQDQEQEPLRGSSAAGGTTNLEDDDNEDGEGDTIAPLWTRAPRDSIAVRKSLAFGRSKPAQ